MPGGLHQVLPLPSCSRALCGEHPLLESVQEGMDGCQAGTGFL